jgi:hypothetical protein
LLFSAMAQRVVRDTLGCAESLLTMTAALYGIKNEPHPEGRAKGACLEGRTTTTQSELQK